MKGRALALMVMATGCGPPPTLAPPPKPVPTEPAPPPFKLGDFVTYRYDGSALEGEVVIEQEVRAVRDGVVTIVVVARRGAERRKWEKVITDTPENRRANRIDALVVVEGDKRRSIDVAAVRRLYSWVLPPRPGKILDLQRKARRIEAPGGALDATCLVARQVVGGKPADVQACDASGFVWKKVLTEMRAPDGGAILYRMRILAHGRRGEHGVPEPPPPPRSVPTSSPPPPSTPAPAAAPPTPTP